jgi:hypothetical protein
MQWTIDVLDFESVGTQILGAILGYHEMLLQNNEKLASSSAVTPRRLDSLGAMM